MFRTKCKCLIPIDHQTATINDRKPLGTALIRLISLTEGFEVGQIFLSSRRSCAVSGDSSETFAFLWNFELNASGQETVIEPHFYVYMLHHKSHLEVNFRNWNHGKNMFWNSSKMSTGSACCMLSFRGGNMFGNDITVSWERCGWATCKCLSVWSLKRQLISSVDLSSSSQLFDWRHSTVSRESLLTAIWWQNWYFVYQHSDSLQTFMVKPRTL